MLETWCPRCPTPLVGEAPCPTHGDVGVLRRPAVATYDDFAALLLGHDRDFPVYVPWPMGPGWAFSDLGVVQRGGRTCASVTGVAGTTDPDGPVDVLVVTEEPGVGLGRRIAGTVPVDPGLEIGEGQPTVRVRIDSQTVPLWPVSTSGADDALGRSVMAGEADGRWLWIVLRPASAVLLLRDDWILKDAAEIGPTALDLPFEALRPEW